MDWDVKTVQALPDHQLVVELADGRKGVFDMRQFLARPGLQRLRDPAYFMRVEIRFGALTWPHDEDIAPDTLAAHLEAIAVA
ncbi:MAG: DUF2442 domain-containing protein [Burkholderiaceae bacterium]